MPEKLSIFSESVQPEKGGKRKNKKKKQALKSEQQNQQEQIDLKGKVWDFKDPKILKQFISAVNQTIS